MHRGALISSKRSVSPPAQRGTAWRLRRRRLSARAVPRFLSHACGTSRSVMHLPCPAALPGSARGRDTAGTVPGAATRRHLRPTATVSRAAVAAYCRPGTTGLSGARTVRSPCSRPPDTHPAVRHGRCARRHGPTLPARWVGDFFCAVAVPSEGR